MAKILLVPLKYELNFGAILKCGFFQYCDSNISSFSIALCNVITLNLLYFIYGIISLLLFLITLSKVIALPTIALAIELLFHTLRSDSDKSETFR